MLEGTSTHTSVVLSVALAGSDAAGVDGSTSTGGPATCVGSVASTSPFTITASTALVQRQRYGQCEASKKVYVALLCTQTVCIQVESLVKEKHDDWHQK